MDILKRYRNHPSLILYSCMGEGMPGEDVYRRWRKQVLALDSSRPHIIVPNPIYRLPWLDQDWPTGTDDVGGMPIRELKDYYRLVRGGGKWMFPTEIPFLASLPSVDTLQKFIPDLWETDPGPQFPVNPTWAHHRSNHYFDLTTSLSANNTANRGM